MHNQDHTFPLAGRRVGVIGLGLMGEPMALNLKRAGAQVWGFNRSKAVLQRVASEGVEAAASARELVAQVDDVILMLSDTPAVASVLLGEGGILDALQPAQLLIDMGTTEASHTQVFAQRVADMGAHYVDAPVSGGQVGAMEASLSIMAGGDERIRPRAQALFDVLGKRTTWVGAVGAGQVAKAANQVIVGLTIAAVSEGMALAQSGGVAPALLREALLGGFADSNILKLHGQRMAESNFKPGARAATQLKDLHQALTLASAHQQDLPVTGCVTKLYEQLCQGEGRELDQSALFTLYQEK